MVVRDVCSRVNRCVFMGIIYTRVHGCWNVMYRLAQGKHKSCPPRLPHAIDTGKSHTWYHTDRHEQWKRVTWPLFFVQAPHRPQSFKTVNNGPAFPQEDNFLLFYFFDAPGFRFPKARPQKASRKYRSSDYVGPIPSHSCRPKLLLYWNLVIKGNY